MQKAITDFRWQAFSTSFFTTLETKMFDVFCETLKNIFSNYIPHRRIKIDNRWWMTSKILVALKKKSGKSTIQQLNTYLKHYSEIVIDTKDKVLNRLSVK